jgi:hypothetical protein
MPLPSHSSWFDHPNKTVEECRSLSSLLRSLLHLPVTASLLGPNILISTLFSDTLKLLNINLILYIPVHNFISSSLYQRLMHYLSCTKSRCLINTPMRFGARCRHLQGAPFQLLTSHHFKWPSNLCPNTCCRKCVLCITWEVFSTSHNPLLEDHPLLAVRDCLFNIFAATLHIGVHSSTRYLRKRNAVVTGTHLSWLTQCTRTLIT